MIVPDLLTVHRLVLEAEGLVLDNERAARDVGIWESRGRAGCLSDLWTFCPMRYK